MNGPTKVPGGGQGMSTAAAEWVAGSERLAAELLMDSTADGQLDNTELFAIMDAQGQASLAATTVSELLNAQDSVLDNITQNLKA